MKKVLINKKSVTLKKILSLLVLISLVAVFLTPEMKLYSDISPRLSDENPYKDGRGKALPESYYTYTKKTKDFPSGQDRIVIDTGILEINETSGEFTYEFDVSSAGKYNIGLNYFPRAENSVLDINLHFKIDGQTLFQEAENVFLPRIFKDSEKIGQGSDGNDVRPLQMEAPRWSKALFGDNSGYNPEAYAIWFTEGSHKLSLTVSRGAISMNGLEILPPEELLPYAAVLSEYKKKGYKRVSGETELIEAEQYLEKSSSTIYPTSEKADASTSPSNPSYMKLNVLGFSMPNDFVSWNVMVPKTGLYSLSFRVLQNYNRGMTSTRRLKINGQIPFLEANTLEFPFDTNWYVFTPKDSEGEDMLFYLEEGRNYILTLEAHAGRFSESLNILKEAVFRLNEIARKITMVTGIMPDIYRDFNFKVELPDLNSNLRQIREILQDELVRLSDEMGYDGNEILIVRDLIRQLSDFIKDDRSIPSRLGNFRTNISSLGSWLVSMTSQPLTIDNFKFMSVDSRALKGKSGFFKQLAYDLKSLYASFIIDYNTVGRSSEQKDHTLSVWVAAGRDQANIVRNLLDNSFRSKVDASVSISLVNDSSTLLQATLANKGPDIALFVEKTLPVNLAARGALARLDEHDGFKDIEKRFYPSAWIPYTFDGGVYAVPNSQGFNLMFVRTDIFEELGLKIPETWDDLYNAIPVIQRNNMEIGLGGESPTIFETLIMQHSGSFYTDDLKSTTFDSKEVLEAFQMWTSFYREYDIALVYDAFSYFRSGVMPLLIADYTQYNQFALAAPEINGLWEMHTIPGFPQPDGSILRKESSTGTASILMKGEKSSEPGFEFLDWWTETETQKNYAMELEMTMGPAARYNSANVEAVQHLPWTSRELEIINRQWEEVWDIETIPSSYYVARNLANAFRNVVYNKANEREMLNKYGEIIDKEILRKNKELGLN